MKKVLFIIMVSLFLVVGCGGVPEAQKKLETALKALQSGDLSKMKEINPKSEDITKDSNEMTNVLLNAYKKLNYKVKSSKVEGDITTINMDLKAPDLSSYLPEYMQQGMALAFTLVNSSKEESEVAINKFVKEFFEQKLKSKDLKYFEKNVDVIFKKDGKEWKLDIDNPKNKDFIYGITLGFSAFLENLNGNNGTGSNEKIETKYFNKGERGVIVRSAQTVTDVKVVESGEFSKPKEGNEFIVIKLVRENISKDVLPGASLDDYKLETKDKMLIDPVIATEFGNFNYDDLPAGNKVEETIVFEVPKGQAETLNIIERGQKVAVYKLGL